MTSQHVRRSWSEFLDRVEAGQMVAVSRRGRAKLAALPWPRYAQHHAAAEQAVGEPARVSADDDGDAQPSWWGAPLIVVDSAVAKEEWRRLQVWVEAGGHAIIERYGRRSAVLTPVDWAGNASADDATTPGSATSSTG